tara:strand:- start:386 stop:1477 length:1092 start_codon:yes stop_codon:yes gene_type:complete
MKIADVVKQIRKTLPNYTDLFGDVLTIASMSASGGVATVTTTTAHGLATGAAVTIVGVETRTPISAVSSSGLVFSYTTALDHDLTFNWPEHSQVELGGFSDSAWNNSFNLLSSNNRKTFQLQSAEALPTLNGGEYLLEPNRIDGVNGVFGVTVTSATTFTISGAFLDGTYTPVNGKVFGSPRVASVIDIDRALDSYTKQNTNQFWIYVEPIDVQVSKDRSTQSDATATIANGNDIRTRMIDGFNVYVVAPTSAEISASTALDICKHDLLQPMLKTLYGYGFDSGLSSNNEFQTTLNSHRVAAYERAYLVYQYEFQAVFDLTEGDRVAPIETRAFRDIDYIQQVGGDDTENMTANVDLDLEPLT